MELWLRNWKFLRFGISQPFRSCEMRFTVLRNGTRVPKSGFAAVKSFAKWSFPYENRIFHALVVRSRFAAAKWGLLCCEVALVCQKWFHSCENFRREGPEAANWFRSKVPISQRLRNLSDPSFSPVFALFLTRFCSERLPFKFFAFSPDFDHPKTYITSKQIRIKALKSKLKHLKSKLKHVKKNKTKRYGLASL
uniref:Uncharacterized protein n=1 Tax=Vitis vinifera TaxID=29760 RepID=A5BXQ3_VITVI|nr:hypothetical protein VITISV_034394 [Vitis vinifera]